MAVSEQREREGEAPPPLAEEGATRAPRMAHKPVLVQKILELLAVKPDGVYVDGTLGGAGHALAVLEKAGPSGFLLGLDQDGEILKVARENLTPFENRVRIVQANFSDITEVLKQERLEKVDGIYLDLGVSSLQLDRGERGFSFSKEGPIDMRMDTRQVQTALDKVRRSNEFELTRVLKEYGEERHAAKIARGLLEKAKRGELRSTLDMAEIALNAYPPKTRHKGIHPATRTFQALRIWVNEELECLKKFLGDTPPFLNINGRLCVISYHSLEDRIVKHAFRSLCKKQSGFKLLTKKPIRPSEEEIQENPRARSAKLRCLEKLSTC